MKEQDTYSEYENISSNIKILMSVETYELMKKDPRIAEDICNRMIIKEDLVNKKTFNELSEFLKKW